MPNARYRFILGSNTEYGLGYSPSIKIVPLSYLNFVVILFLYKIYPQFFYLNVYSLGSPLIYSKVFEELILVFSINLIIAIYDSCLSVNMLTKRKHNTINR